MKKFSALIIMKRMNLWHRIFSISSACRGNYLHRNSQDYKQFWSLIQSYYQLNGYQWAVDIPGSAWLTCFTAMLTRTELMEPSIRTFSLSLRLMITGWSSNSLLLLEMREKKPIHLHFTSVERQNQFTSLFCPVLLTCWQLSFLWFHHG